jgi:hypothetical protein
MRGDDQMTTTIDINATTYITSRDGYRWDIYREGSLTSAMWGTEAEARERAQSLTRTDSQIMRDDHRERTERRLAENGYGTGFRAPR